MASTGGRLSAYPNFEAALGNFSNMGEIARERGIESVDGILLDIGVSSFQLDTPERGFSYHHDAPLDMRMSKKGTSAKDLVNKCSEQELSEILFRFGEEKNARRIARKICEVRGLSPIETTGELAQVIKDALPAAVKREQGHPARKSFQALRIAVNGELEVLEKGLDAGLELLRPGGRFVVITFHSLEDRIVKQKMAKWCEGCICPKDFPVCVCGRKPKGTLVYKKGLVPSEQELSENPRARSARLRVFEKALSVR